VQRDTLQLAVDAPTSGLRVVLAAGELDRTTSFRLARLIEQQAGALDEGGHIVIDLANVRFFGGGGLEVLGATRDMCRRIGVAVHLAGLGARQVLLPQRVIGLLGGFSTYDTLEEAMWALSG